MTNWLCYMNYPSYRLSIWVVSWYELIKNVREVSITSLYSRSTKDLPKSCNFLGHKFIILPIPPYPLTYRNKTNKQTKKLSLSLFKKLWLRISLYMSLSLFKKLWLRISLYISPIWDFFFNYKNLIFGIELVAKRK